MKDQSAKINARPSALSSTSLSSGVHMLSLGTDRDGLIYIPRERKGAHPLLVLLHGAGGKASHMLIPFKDLADHTGSVLLIPESREQTWDVIMGGYGDDVDFIDEALEKIFHLAHIDEKHIGIGGFSDGASYALSLGLNNGDLFSHVMAFSPGFMAPPMLRDSPPLFISHGTQDQVLNIDRCSRKLVPLLDEAGQEVIYKEFGGGHTIPPDIIKEAAKWFLRERVLDQNLEKEIQEARVKVNQKDLPKT